jgi:putative ABC transport system permease protein
MIAFARLAYDLKHALRFVVTRRRREIGIRLALGALPSAAVRLILRETAILVVLGLTVALPVTWALGRLVESQLFGVRAMDGLTIGVAAALVASVAFVASALPARRASAVSPTEALRAE